MSSRDGKRRYLHKHGHPVYRLVRYADDLVLLVRGTEPQAKALLAQLTQRVQALGLKLKSEKTAITHLEVRREGRATARRRVVLAIETLRQLRWVREGGDGRSRFLGQDRSIATLGNGAPRARPARTRMQMLHRVDRVLGPRPAGIALPSHTMRR